MCLCASRSYRAGRIRFWRLVWKAAEGENNPLGKLCRSRMFLGKWCIRALHRDMPTGPWMSPEEPVSAGQEWHLEVGELLQQFVGNGSSCLGWAQKGFGYQSSTLLFPASTFSLLELKHLCVCTRAQCGSYCVWTWSHTGERFSRGHSHLCVHSC